MIVIIPTQNIIAQHLSTKAKITKVLTRLTNTSVFEDYNVFGIERNFKNETEEVLGIALSIYANIGIIECPFIQQFEKLLEYSNVTPAMVMSADDFWVKDNNLFVSIGDTPYQLVCGCIRYAIRTMTEDPTELDCVGQSAGFFVSTMIDCKLNIGCTLLMPDVEDDTRSWIDVFLRNLDEDPELPESPDARDEIMLPLSKLAYSYSRESSMGYIGYREACYRTIIDWLTELQTQDIMSYINTSIYVVQDKTVGNKGVRRRVVTHETVYQLEPIKLADCLRSLYNGDLINSNSHARLI